MIAINTRGQKLPKIYVNTRVDQLTGLLANSFHASALKIAVSKNALIAAATMLRSHRALSFVTLLKKTYIAMSLRSLMKYEIMLDKYKMGMGVNNCTMALCPSVKLCWVRASGDTAGIEICSVINTLKNANPIKPNITEFLADSAE